ncbi:hypothetical protein V5G94_24620, partial [Citrobacter braakii]
RDLASRIVSTQHHHHDLSVATLHVHINHDDCLEIAVLKGDMGVLVATAYMEEAERFDWLVAMNAGEVLATGSAQQLREKTNSDT